MVQKPRSTPTNSQIHASKRDSAHIFDTRDSVQAHTRPLPHQDGMNVLKMAKMVNELNNTLESTTIAVAQVVRQQARLRGNAYDGVHVPSPKKSPLHH